MPAQAVYQVLVMTNVNKNKIFRIRGKFPTNGVRYFSLQSNNPEVGRREEGSWDLAIQ